MIPGVVPPVKSTPKMDTGIVAAVAVLALWAAGTFFFDAPGWINLLLTGGVFLLIWRVTTLRGGSPREGSGRNDG